MLEFNKSLFDQGFESIEGKRADFCFPQENRVCYGLCCTDLFLSFFPSSLAAGKIIAL